MDSRGNASPEYATDDASAQYLRPGATSGGLLRRRSTAVIQRLAGNDPGPESRYGSQRPNLQTVQSDASTQHYGVSSGRPALGRSTSSKGRVPSLRSSEIRGTLPATSATDKLKPRASVTSGMSYKERVVLLRRQSREILEHIERKPHCCLFSMVTEESIS